MDVVETLRVHPRPALSTTKAALRACYNLVPSTKKDADRIETALTVTPAVNEAYGVAVPFHLFTKRGGNDDGTLPTYNVPRTWGMEHQGVPVHNFCVEGAAISEGLAFSGTLKPYQRRATDRVMAEFAGGKGRDAVLEAGTGTGKTVMAIRVIAAQGRKTAVLVHKDFLMNQWRARLEQFLPGVRVGTLQGPRCDHEGKDVVLCMIQSLVKRDYHVDFFDSVGLVIVDECHHIAAQTFQKCLRPFPGAHRLGLTATMKRGDGLERVVNYLLGPTVCRVTRKKGVEGTTKIPEVAIETYKPKRWKEARNRRTGTVLYPAMITMMVNDKERNDRIIIILQGLIEEGRRIMVVSERRKHLDALLQRLPEGADASLYVGETTKKRKREREAGADCQVLFTTYGMGEEGLDLPWLDTLVMVTPRKNLDQIIGRILRHHPGKGTPRIVDVVDEFSMFYGMGRRRRRLYREKGYTVVG